MNPLKNKIKIKITLLATILIITTGCTIQFQKKAIDNLGGVFKSTDAGNTWLSSSSIPSTTGQPQSIARLNNKFLIMDPSDKKALYYGSQQNGLFYTLDSAKTWNKASGLKQLNPDILAISPNSKCTIYTSSRNKILKSTDCARTWKTIYHHDNSKTKITSFYINPLKNEIILAGTSIGELIKSDNKGNSWKLLKKFAAPVQSINSSPFNNKTLFVTTKSKGLSRSTDSGITWTNLNAKIKPLTLTLNISDIQFSKISKDTIIIANGTKLLKTTDNGNTWSTVDLITKERSANINSVVLSDSNPNLIYYSTDTTFYKSTDAGKKWTTVKLPSLRAGTTILKDPLNDNILYLAVNAKK